jgi:ADP-heptose:LPS heptosyltransferase
MTGTDAGFQPPRLHQPPQHWAPAAALPENYILIHPTAAWSIKYWAPDSCAATLTRLRDAGLGPLVMTGGAARDEREHCAAIRERAPGAVVDLAGQTDLRGFFYLVSRARLVLAVDGSAAHLGPAFGRPTVALFGPTNHRSWHYETRLSRRLSTTELLGAAMPVGCIPVDRIVAVARELLDHETATADR